MRIKDLKLLPERYTPNGWYSDMQRIGTISWKELILLDINEDNLDLEIKKGFKGAERKLTEKFIKKAYDKLSSKEKELVHKIFKENIGKTMAEILDMKLY